MDNLKDFKQFEDLDDSKEELSKEEKTRRSISLAQRNSSPTYWDFTTGRTETTPAISTKQQALNNVRNENHYFQDGQSQEEIDWFNNMFDPILERLYKKAGQGCDKDAFIKGAITAIMSLNGEFDLVELESMFD